MTAAEHVEDAAAHRELSRLLDSIDPLVAHLGQTMRDLREIQAGPYSQPERLEDVRALGRHGPEERGSGGDHDHLATRAQSMQRTRPRRYDVGIARRLLPRKVIPVPEVDDPILREIRRDLPCEASRSIFPCHHHQDRARVTGEQRGDQKGPCHPRHGEGRVTALVQKVRYLAHLLAPLQRARESCYERQLSAFLVACPDNTTTRDGRTGAGFT